MPRMAGYIHRYSGFVWFHSRFFWGFVLSDAPWRACRRLWWGGFVRGVFCFLCVGGLVVLCGFVFELRATRGARRQLLVGDDAKKGRVVFPPTVHTCVLVAVTVLADTIVFTSCR